VHRRQFLAYTTSCLAFFTLPRSAVAALKEDEMPPGVVMLRIAEVIAKMEDLLLRAASFFDAGQDDELVIGRPQMTLSISTLLKKSKLEGMPSSLHSFQRVNLKSPTGRGAHATVGRPRE
jgi:hypothetical protein